VAQRATSAGADHATKEVPRMITGQRSTGASAGAWPRDAAAATLLAAIVVLAACTGAALAARGQQPAFAETFARARLVVVATVEAAPPADDAFRLAVETSLKGDAGPSLAFPVEPTSIELAKGSRIVLLAMDPATLDFRGTVALTVGPDGAIDPDGLTGVPPTVEALIAGSSTATATVAPTATEAGDRGDAFPLGAVVIVAGVGIAALAIAASEERRRA
jgi:hypothetical protein